MPPKLLTVDDVATLLNVSKRTIEYWQASGRLPGFVRVCGHRRWRSDILTNWIDEGCPELGVCRSTQTEYLTSTAAESQGESQS